MLEKLNQIQKLMNEIVVSDKLDSDDIAQVRYMHKVALPGILKRCEENQKKGGTSMQEGKTPRSRRLGKHPKKFDNRTLQLARYLKKLPTPLVAVDHASRLPADIGMMGNDQYGDCTVAAAGHMVQSWTTYAERGIETIPDSQILAAYRTVSPNDDGAYLLDVLNLWHKTGIGPDKIEAFVEVGPADLTQAKLCIEYFGSCYIGMSLPNVNTFGPWTTPTGDPNPYNGHAVALIAYNDNTQMFKVCTWGEIWDLSYAWFQKYADEGYAALNDILLVQATGKSPEGFDWAALQYDLTHIGDPVTPPAPTPPAPVPPAPVPGPVVAPQFAITVTENPNYVVSLGGVKQTPTHYSPFEAAEHAGDLKLANPSQAVTIESAGRWVVTLK